MLNDLIRFVKVLTFEKIQGGDYVALEPIVEWLVLHVKYSRDISSKKIRSFAKYQLSIAEHQHNFKLFSGVVPEKQRKFFRVVDEKYQATRRYRVDTSNCNKNCEQTMIQAVLMEFGSTEKVLDTRLDDLEKAMALEDSNFEKKYRQFQQTHQDETSLMELACEMLLEKRSELASTPPDIKLGSNAAARQQYEEELLVSHSKESSLKERLDPIQGSLISAKEENNQLNETYRHVQEELEITKEHENSFSLLSPLESEVVLLLYRKKEFEVLEKSETRRHNEEIESLTRELESRDGLTGDISILDREILADELYLSIKDIHQHCRERLANQSQRAGIVSRQVDDIPTRSELIQYEKRYSELHEQLANKLEENRRHVSTYNALNTTYELLQKEVSLVESVSETFRITIDSKRGRHDFLEQLGRIVEGLRSRYRMDQGRLQISANEKERNELEYQKLIDRQRDYYKGLKIFQDACDLNESMKERSRTFAKKEKHT